MAITSADSRRDLSRLRCGYVLRNKRSAIEREGQAVLADISALLRNARVAVLLIAAADVSLLRMAIPPLSAARLRAALPNLIEDKLLVDVSDCVVACSVATEGQRDIAVMQRAWLSSLVQTLQRLGAQHIRALPEQFCLTWQAGCASVALSESDNGIALSLRLSEHDGLGTVQSSPEQVLHNLLTLIPEHTINLYVPPGALSRYQILCATEPRIKVGADNGTLWDVSDQTLDLMSGLGLAHQAVWNWRPWRWSLALAASLLLVNTLALDIDWWRMSREAASLRASMKQIYLSTYPKETVILDPLLQMRQKIAAGKSGSDEFTTLMAGFGSAWASANPATTITGFEYREHSLIVQLKSEVPPVVIQTALAAHRLELTANSNLTWQIRSKS